MSTTSGSQTTEIGHILSNSVEIVTRILVCLNAKELNNCGRVCRFWASLASRLKKRRHTLAWTCFPDLEGSELEHEVTKFIQNLYSEPTVVFMFCGQLYMSVSDPDCSSNARMELYAYVRAILPKDCALVAAESGGVVGTSSDLKQTYEEEGGETCVSFLCVPHHDDITIRPHLYHMDEIDSLNDSVHPAPEDKLLLTFFTDHAVMYSIASPDCPDALIAGGFVDNIVPVDRLLDGEEDMLGLLSVGLGGGCMRVASVVIRENVRSPAKVEELVKSLKSQGLPEKHSFAFMFACVGRGEGLYQEQKVESTIFHKHFPNTPLVGFFGNGEIGFNFVSKALPSMDEDGRETKKRKSKVKIHHAYTTILVLVSLEF